MSKGDPVPQLPQGAPKQGEVYKHYKGDQYRVVDMALHSNDEEWMIIYEPLYDAPVKLFTRPLREWAEAVEWQGAQVGRFERVI